MLNETTYAQRISTLMNAEKNKLMNAKKPNMNVKNKQINGC